MNAREELDKAGCIYQGHFVGTSDNHLEGYCNIDPLLPRVEVIRQLVSQIVGHFKDDEVETIAAPAIGAIPFSHWGAHELHNLTKKAVAGVWADKVKTDSGKGFAFERQGFSETVKDHRVLILEDIINQGFTIKSMIDTVRRTGGQVVGVGAIAAIKTITKEFLDVPKFIRLAPIDYQSWAPAECELCAKKAPIITDVGHGHEFEIANPDYSGGFKKLFD